MRLRLVGLSVVFGLSLCAGGAARAQDSGFSDPFFLYYSVFLPRQNALASQGQPEDFFRNQSLQRQAAVQNDRGGLFDPISSLGQEELDVNRTFGRQSGSSRSVRTVPAGIRTTVSLRGHSAPSDSFQRTNAYFPSMRGGMGRGSGAAGFGGGRGGSSGGAPFSPNPRAGMTFR